jgi:hypothetical protein
LPSTTNPKPRLFRSASIERTTALLMLLRLDKHSDSILAGRTPDVALVAGCLDLVGYNTAWFRNAAATAC